METPPAVPYQAYRSKRHSRTVSLLPLVPNILPPPMSRPSSVISNAPIHIAPAVSGQSEYFETEKVSSEYPSVDAIAPVKTPVVELLPPPSKELPSPPSPNGSSVTSESSSDVLLNDNGVHDVPPTELETAVTNEPLGSNGKGKEVEPVSLVASPSCSNAPLPPAKQSSSSVATTVKKVSTFRRVPLRPSAARSPLPSSPLRPPEVRSRAPSASSSVTRQFDQSLQVSRSPPLHSRVTSVSSVLSEDKPYNASNGIGLSPSHRPNTATRHLSTSTLAVHQPQLGLGTIQPPPRSSSMLVPPQPPPKSVSLPATSLSVSPAMSLPVSHPSLPFVATRSSAPYRPGFQPKGVYRPRTDEFYEARKTKSDATRIERTKLERRLEKLINLHFPIEGNELKEAKLYRRSSNVFDLDLTSLRNMDASEIWKGVLHSQALQGAKGDIRAAEQRITPWQEDSTVSKCPLCSTSFHPLTNRKHHCRLCGQIICSLPVKRPQRPELCSTLFIVDSKTRRIEEVSEGVDYGVKRRGSAVAARKGNGKGKEEERDDILADDEKFLRGVRVCKRCKPILAREQYSQEVSRAPAFIRWHEALINLEKEIEESLPRFQELLMALNSDSQPTKEASAIRKRILGDFASYDVLSKRIRAIPCTPGSSQERVQLAIQTRANFFLQKNMFPLQSLPKPKKHPAASSDLIAPLVDPDSELARALQPLLEQEALLESFVGEATAHRKFEDAKTLKENLKEIRAEIDKMLENGTGMEGR
ncbi:hypothetical protein PAXRUDRAFT_826719 [Paxillus rubicundulus Ve08.2h10]|uniref:FYVE-type domain-containing protein n=1 Tax=Paxillus rubicundulus Ve08.2h10 TaxID=930991 RepID=A0A0D0DE68_9AGAM|nr:hypothetical protein PAXRUDRAFT_826719 [Paxillus rubicundulus Ve08.2h10]